MRANACRCRLTGTGWSCSDNWQFLDLAGGKEIAALTGPAERSVRSSSHPMARAYCSRHGAGFSGESVQKWDAVNGKDLGPISLPLPLACIAVSPDGKMLAGLQLAQRRPLWPQSARQVYPDAMRPAARNWHQRLPAAWGCRTRFSPDRKILATSPVQHWMPLKRPEKSSCTTLLCKAAAAHSISRPGECGRTIQWSFRRQQDVRLVRRCGETLGLWDTTTGQRVGSLSLPDSAAVRARRRRFRPTAAASLWTCLMAPLALYELATGQPRRTFGKDCVCKGNQFTCDRSSSFAFSPDGKSLVGAGRRRHRSRVGHRDRQGTGRPQRPHRRP